MARKGSHPNDRVICVTFWIAAEAHERTNHYEDNISEIQNIRARWEELLEKGNGFLGGAIFDSEARLLHAIS